MTYAIFILRRAQKELQQLPREDYERVRDAIRALAYEPRPAGCRVLTGRTGWRIRVGTYRVIYEINDTQRAITIFHVGHRRDVYR
jgi:mRNA interferase RelE/StbE